MTKEKVIPQIRFSGFTDTWEQRKLGDIASDMVAGGDIDKDLILAEGQYPVIANALTGDGIVGYYDKEYRVNAPAVTVTGRGDVGHAKARLVNFTPVVRLLSVKSEHDVFFLENVINTLKIVIESTGVPQLTVPQLAKYEVAFPRQLDEEEHIGAFFKQLDHLITLHQRKYDKLTKVKKAMLEKMFPKNGSLYPEIRFKDFTDAWEQRKFSELTEIRSASRVHKEEWQSSGVPFYRSSDVMAALNGTENEKAFISEELYEKLSAVSGKLEKGDILVTGGGSVGKPYIVPNNEPLYTKDADLLWVKNNEKLVPYFIYTFFFSPAFSDYLNSVSHVGTIAHYTITQLEETPITLPCVSEQQKIGDYFRNIDSLITLHQRKQKNRSQE